MKRWIADWSQMYAFPSESTCLKISASPEALPATACLWIFCAGVLFTTSSGFSYALTSPVPFEGFWIKLPILAIGIGGGLTFSFVSSVAIKQWLARLQGGTGDYSRLVYLFGAIYSPFALACSAGALLAALPSMKTAAGTLAGSVFLYALYLQVLAVKSINSFKWRNAILSVFIPFAWVLLACGFLYRFLV